MQKSSIKQHIFNGILALVFLCVAGGFNNLRADEHKSKEFKAGDFIMHHIKDAHTIHIIGPVSIPLPIIAYTEQGVDMFSSSNLYDHDTHHEGAVHTTDKGSYFLFHEKLYQAEVGATLPALITEANFESISASPVKLDLSITKSVAGFIFVSLLVLLLFTAAARGYKKNKGKAPKGIQSVLEPLVVFIRDEVAVPSIGSKAKAEAFLPFLLTIFFMIWIANILGLIPFIGGFNITGTLSITLVLSVLVLIITVFSGNKHYWGHIFWPPGVPFLIKCILVPIEVASTFLIKPAVLMIRLTANITAGHIIILSFVSLILIFAQGDVVNGFVENYNNGAGFGVAIGSVLFMCFMFLIEVLVAFLQAYVFTLLTALYFGDAKQEAHH